MKWCKRKQKAKDLELREWAVYIWDQAIAEVTSGRINFAKQSENDFQDFFFTSGQFTVGVNGSPPLVEVAFYSCCQFVQKPQSMDPVQKKKKPISESGQTVTKLSDQSNHQKLTYNDALCQALG